MTMWIGESGPPDFGKYDDEHHRHCMVHRWCHVCGANLKHPLICSPTGPQRRMVDGKEVELYLQPWVCAPCLAYAAVTCPPLRSAMDRAIVLAPTESRLIATFWKPANPGDPVPPLGLSVISSFKIQIVKGGVQLLRDWMGTAGKKALQKIA